MNECTTWPEWLLLRATVRDDSVIEVRFFTGYKLNTKVV